MPGTFLGLSIADLIANIPALVIGFAFHEFAHAFVADSLGDPTPRSQGRLTLNPLAHLDIFGALLILVSGFGWAKPVQINPRYFKGDPVRSRMLVSLAGPFMNFLVALIGMFILVPVMLLIPNSSWVTIIIQVLKAIVLINLSLGVFNLIPVPPLDGFAILVGIAPKRWLSKIVFLESYGMIILALLIFSGVVGMILTPAVNGVANLFSRFVLWVASFFIHV